MSEPQQLPTPDDRVASCMTAIRAVLRAHGCEIMTQITYEPTTHGDRAIVGAQWAVAARTDWRPDQPG
jgi:hypothetical protein